MRYGYTAIFGYFATIAKYYGPSLAIKGIGHCILLPPITDQFSAIQASPAMEITDLETSNKTKKAAGRPKRDADEPPKVHITDVEVLAAELAYQEVSALGPNKNLEEDAKLLYEQKLRWVDANVKPFVVVQMFTGTGRVIKVDTILPSRRVCGAIYWRRTSVPKLTCLCVACATI